MSTLVEIAITPELNAARLAATAQFFDAGDALGHVRLYDDSDAAGRRLLAKLQMKKPCGVIVDGLLVLAAGEDALVLTTGTATSADLINGAGVPGAVGLLVARVDDDTVQAPIRIPEVQLYAGGSTRLASGVLG